MNSEFSRSVRSSYSKRLHYLASTVSDIQSTGPGIGLRISGFDFMNYF